MTDNPSFSVLMSLYKKENPAFLRESLESILKNTMLPSEIVLVEDGPLTEELENVLKEYQGKTGLFRCVVHPQNQGLGIALRDGVLACKNEIIARGDLYTGKTYLAVGTPVCKLFKKSVILDYNLQFDTTLKNREDSLFVFSYLHFCEKYTATNKTYYNYYKNDRGSATERFDTGRIEADKKYLKFLSHWLEVEKIPHSQEIMASEIVNSIRSLTTSLLKNNASISDSYPISLNFYAQILGGFSLPNTAFQFKTKLVMMALRRRIYTPVFLYYWIKFRRGR